MPAIGWIAREGDSNHRSVDIPAGGEPPLPSNNEAIVGEDPTTNRLATSIRSVARNSSSTEGEFVAQDDWIRHLVSPFGGVDFYSIDNEPDLSPTTHTDVHPVQPDYAEMLAVFVDYASAIKDRRSVSSRHRSRIVRLDATLVLRPRPWGRQQVCVACGPTRPSTPRALGPRLYR